LIEIHVPVTRFITSSDILPIWNRYHLNYYKRQQVPTISTALKAASDIMVIYAAWVLRLIHEIKRDDPLQHENILYYRGRRGISEPLLDAFRRDLSHCYTLWVQVNREMDAIVADQTSISKNQNCYWNGDILMNRPKLDLDMDTSTNLALMSDIVRHYNGVRQAALA
jgi:hypothetical protein